MSFILSDEYTFLPGTYCIGDPITYHTTLEAAKAACVNNIACGCIQDYYCDSKGWSLHKEYGFSTDGSKTCAWIESKSKLTFPFHTKKLVYFTM